MEGPNLIGNQAKVFPQLIPINQLSIKAQLFVDHGHSELSDFQ